MVEEDAEALARLELLSNTAMLKKVLDMKGDHKHEKSDDKSSSNYKLATGDTPPSRMYVPSPASSHGDNNQRGESPSLHTIMDSTSDAPPMIHERQGYALIPRPYYHYNPADFESSRDPSSHIERAHYPENGAHSRGYLRGLARGDAYMVGRHRMAPVDAPRVPPHHHRTGLGLPYPMKENIRPRHYLTPAMYDEHGVVDARRSMMPEAMYYHPPRMATAEDHDDSSTRSYEKSLARENANMREQLKEKDMVVSSLQQRVNYLEKHINELRQLPTGKISHIPIE
jgi:hypothetical protein